MKVLVKRLLRLYWWALICIVSCQSMASPIDMTRQSEIESCLAGEIVTWPDGVDQKQNSLSVFRISYDHRNAPEWFGERQVTELIAASAKAWSECGVAISLSEKQADASVLIQWNEVGSRGNTALSNFVQRTISLSPNLFRTLRAKRPDYDARYTLQMTISHEIGHFLGMRAHSKRCVDVMSYYADDKGHQCLIRDASLLNSVPEYRSDVPTACDIKRCQALWKK